MSDPNATEIGISPIHGQGRFAGRNFKSGELVYSFNGSLMTKNQFEQLKQGTRAWSWLPTEQSDLVRVAQDSPMMNSTMLNHSCQPNLKYQDGQWYAREDIPRGTELTTDYSELGFSEGLLLLSTCNCGQARCRGQILSREGLPL